MPQDATEAYDRATRKIWRAFTALMLLPIPAMWLDVYCIGDNRTLFALRLGYLIFWCLIAVPVFVLGSRKSIRDRSFQITNTQKLFPFPVFVAVWSFDSAWDIPGPWNWSPLAAYILLSVLLYHWAKSLVKNYQVALAEDQAARAEPAIAK